jgi:hypothetical protein
MFMRSDTFIDDNPVGFQVSNPASGDKIAVGITPGSAALVITTQHLALLIG